MLIVAVITTVFLTYNAQAVAGINKTLSFQGRLLMSSGAVVPDGYYNMQFTIYQDGDGTQAGNTGGTGGAYKWSEAYINNGGTSGVQVKNGFFSVNLGSVTPFGTSVDWNQDTLWISMNIGGKAQACTSFGSAPCVGDGEMLPMKRLTATPFALNSAKLEGLGADDFIKNQTSQQTGNFNISGTGVASVLQGNTSIITPLVDGTVGGTLSVGTANASAITIGSALTTTTFAGNVTGLQSLTFSGNFTTANTYRMALNGTLTSSTTSSQFGIQNQLTFAPTGAALTNLFGTANTPMLSGSAAVVENAYASYNRLDLAASYTGNVTNGYGIRIDDPTLTGGSSANGTKIKTYVGLFVDGTSNGGNNSDFVNNYGIRLTGSTGTAAAGGTVRNYGMRLTLSTGGGTGTNQNYGIYIDGNGGTGGGTTNYAIYNSSTAANYLQGNVSIGTANNPSSSALNVSGSTNTSSAYMINGTNALTDSSLAFGNAGTASTINSAATSLTVNNGGNASASFSNTKVQIGDGSSATGTTLLTLDQATTTPGSAALGSMYYDTTLGKVQCYQASGWGMCGNSPDTFVTLSPQYSNSVMNAAGTGTISSDFCSNDLSINTGVCNTRETQNYYGWTSSEATDQTRSIYVTYQLPSTFKNFVEGSTNIKGRTDSSNAAVTYQLYKSHGPSGLTACSTALSVSTGSQSFWQKNTATGADDPDDCAFEAGDSLLIRIDLKAKSNAHAYVSDLNFAFSNK